jgi:hypothetical protein
MKKGDVSMTSQALNRWIVQLFVVDLLICLLAYALQQVNGKFVWVLIPSLIVLFWLAVAGVCSFIERVVERE